jgi:hypothetical protein
MSGMERDRVSYQLAMRDVVPPAAQEDLSIKAGRHRDDLISHLLSSNS